MRRQKSSPTRRQLQTRPLASLPGTDRASSIIARTYAAVFAGSLLASWMYPQCCSKCTRYFVFLDRILLQYWQGKWLSVLSDDMTYLVKCCQKLVVRCKNSGAPPAADDPISAVFVQEPEILLTFAHCLPRPRQVGIICSAAAVHFLHPLLMIIRHGKRQNSSNCTCNLNLPSPTHLDPF